MPVDGHGSRSQKAGHHRDNRCGILSIAILLVVNHTHLIIDRRPPPTPPGTTFNAAKDAGADVTPTPPESPIKPTPPGPTPVQPASPAK
jgi:hypothetical protein